MTLGPTGGVSVPSKYAALVLLPPAVVLIWVLRYTVDVPAWDDWNTPGRLYTRMVDGDLDLGYFFTQYNESRPAFPRLLFAFIGKTVGWFIPAFTLLNWLLALLTLVAVVSLGPRSRPETAPSLPFALLVSLVLFSPAQYENQLWAIQAVVFLPPLCLAGALWLQSRAESAALVFLGCAAVSFVATFSFSIGLICWALAFPLPWLVARPARAGRVWVWAWASVYVALGVASAFLYFRDYVTPAASLSIRETLEEPLAAVTFFSVWVGAPYLPFARTAYVGMSVLGVALLGAAGVSLLLVVRAWRASGDPRLVASCYPWMVFGAYGVVAGTAATIGRVDRGLSTASAARYATSSLWILVGLAGMAFVLSRRREVRAEPAALKRLTRRFGLATLAVGGLLIVPTWIFGPRQMERRRAAMEQSLLTLRFSQIAPMNPLLDRLSPTRPVLLETARRLEEEGLLNVDFVGPWLVAKLHDPDGDRGGRYTQSATNTGAMRLAGFAVIPGRETPPDCVVVAVRIGERLQPVSALTLRMERPGVVRMTGKESLLRSGFSEVLPAPEELRESLELFAVDLDERKVFRLIRTEAR